MTITITADNEDEEKAWGDCSRVFEKVIEFALTGRRMTEHGSGAPFIRYHTFDPNDTYALAGQLEKLHSLVKNGSG